MGLIEDITLSDEENIKYQIEQINSCNTKEEVAEYYSVLIREYQGNESYSWQLINDSIIKKYGIDGLKYIKKKAWNIYQWE